MRAAQAAILGKANAAAGRELAASICRMVLATIALGSPENPTSDSWSSCASGWSRFSICAPPSPRNSVTAFGGKPQRPRLRKNPVAVVKWVDGTVLDTVWQAGPGGV